MNPGHIGIKLAWEDCLPLARSAGFEGIDVPVSADTDVKRCQDLLSKNGLRPGGIAIPVGFLGDEKSYRDARAVFPEIIKKSAAIGQTRFFMWIMPFSDELTWKQNFSFHVERLSAAARILAEHDCRLGLEFLGPKKYRTGHKYSFVHTLEQMLDLATAVGPNAGLLLDSWHWHTSLGTVDEILSLTPQQVVYVHVNDAPAGIPVEMQEDLIRCIPGETGVEDLPGFLDALRKVGYDGPVVPEPFCLELNSMSPEDAARRVGDALKKVWLMPALPQVLPAKMKAVATGRKKAWIVELPVPQAQGHEVIVKLHVTPICGSNMGGFLGDAEHVNEGHEGAGEVVAVAQSNRLSVGDRVALAPLNACGRCADCLRGDVIFCRFRPRVYGNFAQYTRVADIMCVKVPDDISYEHASLMGCALGPAFETTKRLCLRPADTVVISGLGPVGLGAVALASWHGTRIIALDPEPYRRDLAKKLGAAEVLDPTLPTCRDALMKVTQGCGVFRGVDCSGKAASERMLIDLAATSAIIAFVGENQDTIPVSPSVDMIRRGLTIIGCWHMNMLDTPELIEFLRRNPAKADLLISHKFGFDRVQEAFDTFASRKTSKVLLLPWK